MPNAGAFNLTDAPKALFIKLTGWARDFVVMLPNQVLAALTIAVGIVVSRLVPRLAQRVLLRTTGKEPISRLLAQIAFLRARSEAMIAIKRAFDEQGITIPFPIRTLDFGAKLVGGTRLDELGIEPPKRSG